MRLHTRPLITRIFTRRGGTKTLDIVVDLDWPRHPDTDNVARHCDPGSPLIHCDAAVLHAPGECAFCDNYPIRQLGRQLARINFTGGTDPTMAPCPATVARPLETINRWGGNRPGGTTAGA